MKITTNIFDFSFFVKDQTIKGPFIAQTQIHFSWKFICRFCAINKLTKISNRVNSHDEHLHDNQLRDFSFAKTNESD